MKQGELARRTADLMYALQEDWMAHGLGSSAAAYGALRADLGVGTDERLSPERWLGIMGSAVDGERIEAVRRGKQQQDAFLGMERHFPAMQETLQAEGCTPGTQIRATDTGKVMTWDGTAWNEEDA